MLACESGKARETTPKGGIDAPHQTHSRSEAEGQHGCRGELGNVQGPGGPRRGLLLSASPQLTGPLQAIKAAGSTAARDLAD